MLQNMRRNEQGMRARNILTGLLVGGLMGTGLALLRAPQSGAETRRQIRLKATEFQDKTAQAVASAQSRVEQAADRIAEKKAELLGGGPATPPDVQEHVYGAVK